MSTVDVYGASKDTYKRVNGEWVRHDIYRKVDGAWVIHDEYLMELDKEIPDDCLTFSSQEWFKIDKNLLNEFHDGTLYYSHDDKIWREWDGINSISSRKHGLTHRIYMRGVGNSIITGYGNHRWVLSGSDISCYGNIETLLDYEAVQRGEHPTMGYACFNAMFAGCENLVKAPELPATNLSAYCYAEMFLNCTGLTEAPALPATTLEAFCYYDMFRGCDNLSQIPELPATTLAESCYSYMFRNCDSIKLSTTKTEEYQTPYRIPTSGEGTIGKSSMTSMFYGTGGTFKDTPTINTTYYTSNVVVPSKPPVEPESNTIPEGATYTIYATGEVLGAGASFPEAVGHLDTYAYEDYIYTAVSQLAQMGFSTIDELKAYVESEFGMTWKEFWAEQGMTEEQALAQFVTQWTLTVADKTKTSYGEILTAINGWALTYVDFDGCTELTTAPVIPASVVSMRYAFRNCDSLTTAPVIPNSVTDMVGAFYSCESLTTAPVIPASVTDMSSAFSYCKSLTTAPVIPNSVTDMGAAFQDCTSLTTAPVIPASVTGLRNTFYGCKSLTGTVVVNTNNITTDLWDAADNSCYQCFYNTTLPIELTGEASDTVKALLASTANKGNVTYTPTT